MNKNEGSELKEELLASNEVKLLYNWIRKGLDKDWLSFNLENQEHIKLTKAYTESQFGVTIAKNGETLLLTKENSQLTFLRHAKEIYFETIDNQGYAVIRLDLTEIGVEKPYYIYLLSVIDIQTLLDISDKIYLIELANLGTSKKNKLGNVLSKLNVIKKG